MSLLTVTSDSLTRQLAREVPELYVIIAKHSVLGMDNDGIREVIGCTEGELGEVLNDNLYREVRLIIGGIHGQGMVDQTTSWDSLEQIALKNLVARAALPQQDPDFMLRVAAVANKAVRRANAGKENGILDPTHTKKATINLTTRLVRSFTRDSETQTIERTLSIEDGSMQNPTFDEVNGLLTIKPTASLPRQIEIKTATPNVDMDKLDKELQRRIDDG